MRFSRASGGVSQGFYASLNGGVGSSDAPEKVAENRARMAAALGVSAERLLTPYQIHSPDVVVADEPWTHDNRPRADAIVTRMPRLAIGVSTADCGPLLVRRQRGARDRRGACRMARRAHRRDRSNDRGDGDASAPTAAILLPRSGPQSASRITKSDPNSLNVSLLPIGPMRATSEPSERAGHAMFDLTGYIAERVQRAGIEQFEDLGLCTYAEPDRFFSYRRTTRAVNPIMAGISTPLRLSIEAPSQFPRRFARLDSRPCLAVNLRAGRRNLKTKNKAAGVSMEWRGRCRATDAAYFVKSSGRLLAAICALALAGCNPDNQAVSAAQPRGATVAFESIDGLPPGQFRTTRARS